MGNAKFSDDFRSDAVHQIVERGYPVAEVSQRLGVSTHSLYAWVKRFSKQSDSSGKDEQVAEIRRLKRERAVRMVFNHTGEHTSQWAAIEPIAAKIGCAAQTLHTWVTWAERDQGLRAGPTTDERERMKQLERENRELRQANEILRKASAYFAPPFSDAAHRLPGSETELDRRSKT
jgi:transposase